MQRDSWQAALKFKTSAATIINDLGRQIQTLRGYEAFSYLDIENIAQKCSNLMGVIDEIKVSYSAREGLERFLISWRASGLTTDDITCLKQMHRFLSRHVERIVFVNHYLNHRSVTEAVSLEKSVAEKRETALFMLRNIESMILPDEGENFQNTFEIFRDAFVQAYSGYHNSYQKLKVKPVLSKHSTRALLTIKRLSSIQSLDCPRGTRQFIDMCDKPQTPACTRNLSEELMRSPLCSCGFICSDEPPEKKDSSPEYEIERILKEYYQILSDQKIREAISARSFALRDIDNKAHGNLDKLHQFLKKDEFSGTIALRDILDESTSAELNRALSGQARIENRSIRSLQNELSGRRLTPSHIRDVVEKWIGSATDDTVLSLSEPDDQSAYNTADPLLWPFIHKDLFTDSVNERKVASLQINILATELEQNFPSEKLIRTFLQWSDNSLIDFICNEPAHLGAVKGAWSVFINRVIDDSIMAFDREVFSKYLDDTEAVRIKQRMVALRDFTNTLHTPFPQRLKARLPAAAIYKDAWATTRLKSDIIAKIEKISSDAQAWFDTLPPVPEVISPGELLPDVACTILLIDAIPPDVWIAMLEMAPDVFSAGTVKWFRQTSQSLTIESINALFGFAANKDPMEELALRGIYYCTISGDEDRKWLDIIPQPKKGSSQLIRINLFDRQAHSGTISLQDMAPTLANILGKNLPSFISFCKENKRKLLVTTDHGLSFSQKGLQHGTGGIFEKAIFNFLL
jgi:hypothetical protein